MKKELLKRCILGIPIGLAISQLISIFISLCIGDGAYYPAIPILSLIYGSELNAILVQTIASAIYGSLFAGASLIWETDNWSLTKQTLIHLLVTSVVTFPIGWLTHWMQHSLAGVISYFAIFAVIYAIIWITRYMTIKKEIEQLNSSIKQ